MKKFFFRKFVVAVVVFAGFAAMNPVQAGRAPRPVSTIQPPIPVSGL